MLSLLNRPFSSGVWPHISHFPECSRMILCSSSGCIPSLRAILFIAQIGIRFLSLPSSCLCLLRCRYRERFSALHSFVFLAWQRRHQDLRSWLRSPLRGENSANGSHSLHCAQSFSLVLRSRNLEPCIMRTRLPDSSSRLLRRSFSHVRHRYRWLLSPLLSLNTPNFSRGFSNPHSKQILFKQRLQVLAAVFGLRNVIRSPLHCMLGQGLMRTTRDR